MSTIQNLLLRGGLLNQADAGGGGGGDYDYSGKYVLVALMGQSNMVGRDGPIDPIIDATDPDILMWDATGGSWVTAADPLDHIDETADTIGPGLSFAKDFLAGESPAKVLLVGMAEGGTGFLVGDWLPNRVGTTYENVRDRWEAAYAQAVTDYGESNVVVGGALWIQGEDEIQDYWDRFTVVGESRWEYLTMPTSMFEAIRAGDFSGWSTTTPVVFGQVPPTFGLTGTTAYDEIQAGIADLANRMSTSGAAIGTDLTGADSVHYDDPALRTMGSRMYTAHVAARSSTPSINPDPPAFVQDPSNVETAFAFSAVGVGTGAPMIMQEGTYGAFENKRVWIDNGKFTFDREAELRWSHSARQARPLLADRDFLFKMQFNTVVNIEQGLWSCYLTSGNQRSWFFRIDPGPVIQFVGSNTGSSPVLMLEHSISLNTDYEVEIRRVGTVLRMHVDGVLVDSYTLAGGYTFFTPVDTERVHIGEHTNNTEFEGTMEYFSLEYLS